MVIPFFHYVCLLKRTIMNFKTIIVAIVSALAAIILFKNTEQSNFSLSVDIYTSKLTLLCIFYVLGVITGGMLFRRRKKHPTEYGVSNPNTYQEEEMGNIPTSPYSTTNLSDEDKEFIKRD